jgi:hypothetical protein
MRALWWVVCASAGCRFDLPEVASTPDASGDAPPTSRSPCDATDPSLRLCVDFQPPIADRSASGAVIAVTDVSALDRNGEPAGLLTAASTMHVRESVALDLQGALALDMWIRPATSPPAGGAWLLDNNQQYGVNITGARAVRCVLGSFTVDSAAPTALDVFQHVACTYDGATLKVFVNGELSGCANVAIAIPTTGADGLAIGANLSGTDDDPAFADRFVGGIDDVRVWARSDLDVCAIAGRTGCNTVCP